MKIAFVYAAQAYGNRAPIDFVDVESSSLTGTDLVMVNYPRELARRGHDVALYIDRPNADSYEGVALRDLADYRAEVGGFDATIAASYPDVLFDVPETVVRCVNRQVGEFGQDCRPGFERVLDRIFCPSEVALARVSGHLAPAERAKFRHQPNGCSPERLGGVPKIPGLCAYTSSPDRGLHLALQAWPAVLARVPHAKLRIYYYALERWLSDMEGRAEDSEATRRARYIRFALARFAARGGMGVERIGGVSHRQIERELSQAEALVFPCDCWSFTETFSVATLEACAAGAVPCISSADALGGIYREAVGDALTEHPVRERMGEYVDRVVRALTDDAWRAEVTARTRAFAETRAWPAMAELLEQHLDEAVAEKRGRISRAVPAPAGRAELVAVGRPRLYLVLSSWASDAIAIDVAHPEEASKGGGCRAGFMGLVKALGALDRYDVTAFSTFREEAFAGGVMYRQVDQMRASAPPDGLLAYYDTAPLQGVTSPVLRIASHHTFQPNPACFEFTDVNLAPSAYAADRLRQVFDTRAPWYVLPNAVGEVPAWTPVAGRVLYHAPASRGLHLLVELWPRIRARVPGATLHVVGNALEWAASLRGKAGRQADAARRFELALGRAREAGGVEFTGFLSRSALERELAEASCFAFPCAPAGPCETFSVSTMECCKVGVPVVLAPQDALASIYGHNVLLAGDADVFPESFADHVVRVLSSPELAASLSRDGRALAKKYTFERAALALDDVLLRHLPAARRPAERPLRSARPLAAPPSFSSPASFDSSD
ncbi:MAG TPA: glycosyltransferase [Polyangiaceae bacterium]|jgi:glycosyltransferase involved in cell wall biosynthesis